MGIWSDSMNPYGFTLEKIKTTVLQKNRLGLISLYFIKISFKEHTQALIRDKLPEKERDSKLVVAEFQNKNIFSLMEEKTWTISVQFPQTFYNPSSSEYQ